MAISRAKRQELVADYREKLERSEGMILTSHEGLNVAQMNALRNRLRAVGTGYHVVKNTLFGLALQEAKLPELDALLSGPTAVGFCYQDMQLGARVLVEFASEATSLGPKGGLSGRRLLTTEEINRLADLPSRGVLLSQVLSGLQSPITRLLNVLSGSMGGLVTVLRARADQLASAEG